MPRLNERKANHSCVPCKAAPRTDCCFAVEAGLGMHGEYTDRNNKRLGGVMKFGIFYELQLPRPWEEGDELRLTRTR